MKNPQKKVEKVMHEFKEHELTSHGKTVTNPKQAVAIALSEAGLSNKKEHGGNIGEFSYSIGGL